MKEIIGRVASRGAAAAAAIVIVVVVLAAVVWLVAHGYSAATALGVSMSAAGWWSNQA